MGLDGWVRRRLTAADDPSETSDGGPLEVDGIGERSIEPKVFTAVLIPKLTPMLLWLFWPTDPSNNPLAVVSVLHFFAAMLMILGALVTAAIFFFGFRYAWRLQDGPWRSTLHFILLALLTPPFVFIGLSRSTDAFAF